jgi:hypothetical protein
MPLSATIQHESCWFVRAPDGLGFRREPSCTPIGPKWAPTRMISVNGAHTHPLLFLEALEHFRIHYLPRKRGAAAQP